MKEPTLVVLAAGMGSRYGGLKQVDPIGNHGQIIMDYSVYDAVRAGFKKVVFLVSAAMREDFEATIGSRVSRFVETQYVVQDPTRFVPEGFVPPEGRKPGKPWGTGHAVLCCSEAVDGPFVMINADDYYGPSAYQQMYEELTSVDLDERPMRFSMMGYLLRNTVTDSGKVARGICVTKDGMLESIIERTYVVKTPEGAAYSLDDGKTLIPLDADSPVSMNFWGFTPGIFDELRRRLPLFFENALPKNPNDEIYIPNVVGELLREGLCTVKVMESRDVWHGVTYREDKPDVVAAIRRLTEEGLYPDELWA